MFWIRITVFDVSLLLTRTTSNLTSGTGLTKKHAANPSYKAVRKRVTRKVRYRGTRKVRKRGTRKVRYGGKRKVRYGGTRKVREGGTRKVSKRGTRRARNNILYRQGGQTITVVR